MMGLLEKVFGDLNEKEIKKLSKIVDKVEALDEEMQQLSDGELKNKTKIFKERLANGETLDDLLPEAFAVAREAAHRALGMKHFSVQILGGIVLHQGRIAEMKTGEGKTLVATLPVYLNALEGKGVHVVTVNDYLAKRDMEWMGKLYNFLGLSVGCVIHGITGQQRKDAYNSDITYGTNNEFGFDYLRDNMVIYKNEMSQRPLNYAIIDEVDSILIDEARTPLIISGAGEESTKMYSDANQFVKGYKNEIDFTIDEKAKSVSLTESGVEKAEKYFKVENLADPENMELNHHILQALKAQNLMKRDVDYVIHNGEIVIVDEFTGRLMFGRRYSEGLHQAIEAKEGLRVRRESKTLATITLQNYFRMYQKLAGMTGTAKTEEDEFKEIYNMDVVVVPTNKPVKRQDLPDLIYATEAGKFKAIIRQIIEKHSTGQPVLVGTISIEKSELISELLKRNGIKHNVLNAKHHQKEAEIIAEAGRFGAVTIATNMAGRGTDIILGGNPDFEAKLEMRKRGYDDAVISYASSFMPTEDEEVIKARKEFRELFEYYKKERAEEHNKVISVGGLHIIGTERHESRRIDNQLRGRSGRQGDPGSSQFFIALNDELMRLFGGERIQGLVSKMGMQDDEALEANMLTKSIENAQKKVEGRNFFIRKYVLQYDDVMNKQREVIYKERKRVLEGENLRSHILGMFETLVDYYIDTYTADAKYPEEWNLEGLANSLKPFIHNIKLRFDDLENMTIEDLKIRILDMADKAYGYKEEEIGVERMRELERVILLRVVDTKWMDHIDAMDQLKQGIGLRAIGHEDPVRAYQNEGFDMFEDMIKSIQEETVRYMFNVTIQTDTQRKQVIQIGEAQKADFAQGKPENAVNAANSELPERAVPNPEPQSLQPIRKEKTVGRNDPCPCGSGKKYKKCCGQSTEN
ncbi:MAG: preprotein translocase subunit SecA [Clostridiales bacterium]|nr:preprotein translocase subunit SecA [Clostridiales bacterium]